MITSLNLKNIATYDAPQGVFISDLKKVNFFFGFNGAGKSTIVKYLRDISLTSSERNPAFAQCSYSGYDDATNQMLIFDDFFIEENFRKSEDFKGVFSLNQANKDIDLKISEEENLIESHENRRKRYLKIVHDIEISRKTKNENLSNFCWTQRSTFSTFTKIELKHSGSKPNHLKAVRTVLNNYPENDTPAIEKLTDSYNNLYEKNVKSIDLSIDVGSYLQIRRLEVKLNKLLLEVIVGNEDVDIAQLINNLNSRSWVEQGIRFAQTTKNICPFCQKETIDSSLLTQFNQLFDESYKQKISEIEQLKLDYIKAKDLFLGSLTQLQNEYNPNNEVSSLLLTLTTLFEENIRTIDYKLEHSNEKRPLTSLNSLKSNLSEILKGIRLNNSVVNDLEENKKNLLKEIWIFIANNCKKEIQDFDKSEVKRIRIEGLAKALASQYIQQITETRLRIDYLRNQTVNTKEAVDNINILLKNAGFQGFEIHEKDKVNNISRYYLKRLNSTSSNSVFSSLSEGEKNFISFLYYYQLCLGTDDVQSNGSKRKILVIDDPVSSLDSQALFIVSTLIHTLIERKAKSNPEKQHLKNLNLAQVFILTHNTYFYKEVSFDRRPICSDHWHYRITKINNQTSITGSRERSVFDDYSLMWKTIKNIKSNIPTDSSMNIMLSNLMRRIIESYVNFIGYGGDSWASLLNSDKNDPSYYIKCAFISTINDESHKVSALDSAYYARITNEQPQLLFDVFATIFKSIGKDHYEINMDEKLN